MRILPHLDAADFIAEWKWDGIRVQAVSGRDERGNVLARLYSRSGEDITKSFPDLLPSLHLPGAIDGELLVLRDGRVQTFNVLQQRLNRKLVSPKLLKEYPIHLRAYDLLGEGDSDLRALPFAERRTRLETFIAELDDARIDLSPTIAFNDWDALTAARADPAGAGAGDDAEAVEGVMLKRRDAPYLPGRPRGQWWKWKRDPHSDRCGADVCAARPRQALILLLGLYVRGLDLGRRGEELVRSAKPISASPTRSCCRSTASCAATPPKNSGRSGMWCMSRIRGWCWKSPSRDWQRSPRHKSGVAMRFPRISRLRWDKPPREADRLETLERMLQG